MISLNDHKNQLPAFKAWMCWSLTFEGIFKLKGVQNFIYVLIW